MTDQRQTTGAGAAAHAVLMLSTDRALLAAALQAAEIGELTPMLLRCARLWNDAHGAPEPAEATVLRFERRRAG